MPEPTIETETTPGFEATGSASMEKGGFYNRHSAMQAAGISALLPLWETICGSVAIDEGPLVLVDYGSSQGRNSMLPMSMAIAALRARAGHAVPIEVIHTDLPSNDFASLFEALQSDPSSYLAGTSGVFPAAIGRSYFEPLLPPGRVHLGWNSWAMQWLSRSPADAPDQITSGMSRSPEVMTAVAAQQAIDWQRFLAARSLEMRPGAKLLTAFTGKGPDSHGWEWHCGNFWGAVLDMRRAGVLSDAETRRITIPVASRSHEQIMAPFDDHGNRFAGLHLDRAEIVQIADPFWAAFQMSGDVGDLAQRHADITRAWAGPSIMRTLDPARDRAALVDELFARFAARVAADPQRHEPFLGVAVLTKEDGP